MDATCSDEFSDTRTVVLVLLHLQCTHHNIDPRVHSSDEFAVNLFFHHLFQQNLEHLIDHIVNGSPPIPVVSDGCLTVVEVCTRIATWVKEDRKF